MRRVLSKLGAASLLIVASCSSVDTVKLKDVPPHDGQKEVELYASKDQVKRPYDEVAIITVDDQGWGMSDETLAEKLKEKAKSSNADAVIMSFPEHRSGGGTIVGGGTSFGNTAIGSGTWVEDDKKFLRGVAIAYKDHA